MRKALDRQPYLKELPKGQYLFLNRLPRGTSDAELQRILCQHGICLALDHISIILYDDGAAARLSYNHEDVAQCWNWLLNGLTLGGKVQQFVTHLVPALDMPRVSTMTTDADRISELLAEDRKQMGKKG